MQDSKSRGSDTVRVRPPPPAPHKDSGIDTILESLFFCPKAAKALDYWAFGNIIEKTLHVEIAPQTAFCIICGGFVKINLHPSIESFSFIGFVHEYAQIIQKYNLEAER